MLRTLLFIILFAGGIIGSLHAAEPPGAEAAALEAAMKRLRDTLRATMTQLQTAQAEVATLQAAKTEADDKILAQTAKIESLTKQLAADQVAAKKAASEADAQLAGKSQEIARTTEALDKWKAGYKQAAQVANATEARRSQLSAKAVMLERQVTEQRTRNAELYKLGTEILKRYERFGLGNALVAREPFTGIAKVKLQTLIQDYQDNLNDQFIKSETTKTASSKPGDDKAAGGAPDKGPSASAAPVPAAQKSEGAPASKSKPSTSSSKARS